MTSSSRPISIRKLRTHSTGGDSSAKLPAGPICEPKPGPTLPTAVSAAEKAVRRSRPQIDRTVVPTRSDRKNRNTKIATLDSVSIEISSSPYFSRCTEWGWITCRKLARTSW